MKSSIPNRASLLVLFVLMCQFPPPCAHAKSVDLYGNWRATYYDIEDTSTGLQTLQRYDVNWSPLFTEKMRISSDVGYSQIWTRDVGTRESINPAVRYDIVNDLFSFDLIGYAVMENISYSDNRNTYTWDSAIRSAWDAFMPSLALRAGQRFEKRDSQLDRDEQATSAGASVGWEGYKARFFYDYSIQEIDRQADDSILDDARHFVQLEYADNYLANRINLGVTQSYNRNDRELSKGGQNARLRVQLSGGFAGLDFTPSSGRLPSNPLLIDNNLETRAFTIEPQQPANLAVRTDFNRVDRMYIYTTRDPDLLTANTELVTWDLYTSIDGFSWQRTAAGITAPFNRDDFRFEVTTGPLQAVYIKLVATGWLPVENIAVTEVEAYANVDGSQGDFTSISDRYKTEIFAGIIPVEKTIFNYTFSWDMNENTNSRRSDTDNDQLVQSARFAWDYSYYFNPSVGASSVVNNYSHAIDTESRSYDLRIHSLPIPTVDCNLNFILSEYFKEDDLQHTTRGMYFITNAVLYPELTTQLNMGLNFREDEVSHNQNSFWHIAWILRSRLRESLNADFTTEYNYSDREYEVFIDEHLGHGSSLIEQTSGGTGISKLDIYWRPSTVLSLNWSGIVTYGNEAENDRQGMIFSANYLALRTSKTNVTLNYFLNTTTDVTTNNFGVVWSWNISEFFTFRTSSYYYLSDEYKSWNVSTQLTARF